jgi:hypothetical protein
LKLGTVDSYENSNPFPNFTRHVIIIKIFKAYLTPKIINAIMTYEGITMLVQKIYSEHFIRYTTKMVKDVTKEIEQVESILETRKRAHRNSRENTAQILENFYFPGMTRKITELLKNCLVCKENKYDQHPCNPEIDPTPIPSFAGHTLHTDIFSTEGTL